MPVPSMFIPWFVLIVVPNAVLLSVLLFVVRVRAPEVARECHGTCPDCGQAQSFDVPERFELPFDVECANCRRELTLEEHVDSP